MASETMKCFARTQNILKDLQKSFDACPRPLLEKYSRDSLANHAFRWDRIKRDITIVAGFFEGDSDGSLRFLHKFMEDVEFYAQQCMERTARFTNGANADAKMMKEDIIFVGDCGQAIQATLKSLETIVGIYRDRDELKARIGFASPIQP
ncbi:hypothetical protein BJX66DRAFT_331393 [Aspergillus keveii]|uniref:Uncharacterized protein n=1 Tax=Aspergillus keveii TaxID=714993 RepID=A0ABR4GQ63_9EURO